ncbi:MAG: shikimate kinase [Lewinellaceae bacterium]|nr:shikimate kinase [Lewinellaceae bacterium]
MLPGNERIYLLGYMGSGKSHTGKRLANLLTFSFVDLDDLIEKEADQSIASYFAALGEESFRQLERKVLLTTDQLNRTIIACGGGTPCFLQNMEWINTHGLSIYLKTAPALLASRLLPGKAKRPLIAQIPDEALPAFIEAQLAIREHFYEQAAVIYQQTVHEDPAKTLAQFFPDLTGH